MDDVFAPRQSGRSAADERVNPPSQRAVFEALYRAHYLRTHARLPEKLERDFNGDYAQSGVQIAWEIWQVAHAHAFELAAQLCSQREAKYLSQDHKAMCRVLARDIRALLADIDKNTE